MLKKLLILVAIVIILVSLNWFEVLAAQDLSSLSPEMKAALLEKYNSRGADEDAQRYYTTPDLYQVSSQEGILATNGVAQALNEASPTQAEPTFAAMQEFDQLQPFGAEVFRGDNSNDIPVDITSASDYVLGPGDNIIVYLWGRADKEYNLTFDREGKVVVPQVGEIVGWGLTLEQFTEKAKKQFARAFSEFELTVSLGRIRSIRIYVAGEVQRPGAYTVSSLTSVFNALYLAGGPNERGSMRTTRLMRQGKPIAEIDLYQLLLEGDNSSDLRLQTGDVIFVPVAGSRVAIRGEVKRAAIYELKGGETVTDLVKLAGNATPLAFLERIMLERIWENNEWKVLDLNLTAGQSNDENNIDLNDGDRLTVFSIFDAKKNIVAVYGQVKHAGYYERSDSTYLSDLIKRAQLQQFDVLYERADLFRKHTDGRVEIIPVNLREIIDRVEGSDIKLCDRDSLFIYSVEQVNWKKYVHIEGEVTNPGRYPLYDQMTVKDLIFLAGSYTREASLQQAEIARLDAAGDVMISVVDLNDEAGAMEKLIEGDHLYVRKLPQWRRERTVSIEGEVQFPGGYTLNDRAETFYQLLQRAGGFTRQAFPKGTIFTRPSVHSNLERKNVFKLVRESVPQIHDSLGQPRPAYTIDYDPVSMNRIIIDMDRLLASKGELDDIVMQPGDRIYVPAEPSGISVIGATGVNGTIKYVQNQNVKYYVDRAGDFTRQADKKKTRLVRATGEVENNGNILKRKVHQGDLIIVPSKIEKDRDWGKTMTVAISTLTGVLTSVYIVSKL